MESIVEPIQLQIEINDKIIERLDVIDETLSETRIRAIVREELAAWEKSLPLRLRASMGWPAHVEVK